MKIFNALIFSALAVLLLTSSFCVRRGAEPRQVHRIIHIDWNERNWPRATTDADAWLGKFQDAIRNGSDIWPHAYATLPAIAEWPKIIETLKSEDFLGEIRPRNADAGDKRSAPQLKCLIFASLIEGDADATLTHYRDLLRAESFHKQQLDKAAFHQKISHLIDLGMKHDEASDFVGNLYEIKPKRAERDRDKDPKEKWERLLADNEVDAGLAELERLHQAEDSNTLRWLEKIARVAKVTGRDDLLEKTVDRALARIDAGDHTIDSYFPGFVSTYLIDTEQWELLLTHTTRAINKNFGNPDTADDNLGDLINLHLQAIYHEKGAAPMLAELERIGPAFLHGRELYLGLLDDERTLAALIAQAYRETGQPDASLAVLRHSILLNDGRDPLYAALVEHHADAAPAFLDAMRKYDPYQERPLIWQGKMQLAAGDVAAARQSIEAAIALDPSDGEQGKDTRMEVYNVFADIHEAEGDAEKAAFFREVTLSIRLGEASDDFLYAGLISEAIRRYEEALKHFSDAYCLQSRLAKTYTEKGMFENAIRHYEKAFELMPVSFGPVESHCFGCEGIFDDKRVRPIAEKIFQKIIAKSPENPRTYYLYGLLLGEMNAPDRSLDMFIEAFDRDPEYLNAAKRIAGALRNSPQLYAEHRGLMKRIDALAPYDALDDVFERRVDLRAAWLEAEAIATAAPPIVLGELPLPFDPIDDEDTRYRLMIERDSYAPAHVPTWQRAHLLNYNDFLDSL